MAGYFFAYGSLQPGFLLGHLLAAWPVVGVYAAPGYELYLHRDGFPCMVPAVDLAKVVVGTLFRVTKPDLWPMLDEVEGHPREYRRQAIWLARPEILVATSYLYRLDLHGAEVIAEGRYTVAHQERVLAQQRRTMEAAALPDYLP